MSRKKKCLHCDFMKLLMHYGPDERMKDGLSATCKECPPIDIKDVPPHRYSLEYKREWEAERRKKLVSKNQFVTREPYEPAKDRTYYRNNGHPHIKSFGQLC